eukprot:gnl/Spiro4/11614_TR6137_c0_g1_i1.p2 gnl/Spiro4/11614_TR6137_c0_g1~~gnl/Spiro4/11614_TR6137_c0_g1_i1.p2  ORF type:complete len:120 (-),score=16.19 gnl/Spiro4/11614_TR6137_c0_g1_i1:48-407(-)
MAASLKTVESETLCHTPGSNFITGLRGTSGQNVESNLVRCALEKPQTYLRNAAPQIVIQFETSAHLQRNSILLARFEQRRGVHAANKQDLVEGNFEKFTKEFDRVAEVKLFFRQRESLR